MFPPGPETFPITAGAPHLNGDRNHDNHDFVTIDFSAPTDTSNQTSHITISRNFEVGKWHSQDRVRRCLFYLGRSSRQFSGIILDPKCSVSCNISIDNLPRLLISSYFSQLRDHEPDSSKVDFRRLVAFIHMVHKFCFPDHEKWAKTLVEKHYLVDEENGGFLGSQVEKR